MKKICKNCGIEFTKKANTSLKVWKKQKFCSIKCSGTTFPKGIIPTGGIKTRFKNGNNHPFWKGGTTELKHQIRTCLKYRQWRSDVFTRDNFTCGECFKRGGMELHVDHIKQFALIIQEYKIKSLGEALLCEELWNINNGRTLCKYCHRKTKTYSKNIS